MEKMHDNYFVQGVQILQNIRYICKTVVKNV